MYTYSFTFPYGWAVFRIERDGEQKYICSFMTTHEAREFCEWHNNDTENTRTDSSYNTDEPDTNASGQCYSDADPGL